MTLRERIDYGVGLLAVSLLLFLVPVFDMWEDVFVGGKPPLSTVFENSIFLLLTGGLIAASVWLRRSDWEREYVQLVARWSLFGTGVVALVYGWVLGFQLYFQNDLKPFIIAADGIVLGGLALFVAGVYNAQSRREEAARTAERDRFSALFDNTSDAVAAVTFEDDTAVFADVNAPFKAAFGRGTSALSGRPVVETLAGIPEGDAPLASTPDSATSLEPERLRRVFGDPDEQVEIRHHAADGPRDFLVDYVPIGDGTNPVGSPAGFLVFTDITTQKERERQFETLSEGAEGLLDARSIDGVVAAVRTLSVDLFEDAVVGVWGYDEGTGRYRPLLTSTTGTDPVRIEDLPELPPAEEPAEADRDVAGDDVPPFDVGKLVDALSERDLSVEGTLVGRLTDSYRLVVGGTGTPLSTTDRYLADLLVTNARAAVERVDREQRLADRNDQLEFVNSLLRHDIQNAMTVIRARGQVLAESLEDEDAEYAGTIVEQSDDVIELIDRFRALLDALTDPGDADLEPVSLSSAIEERVATLETTHPDAEVTAAVPDGIEVRADGMLENVLGNVLGNAIEHNDTDRPTVEVSATERDGTAVVRIADDGPGVPDEAKETVFRRGDRGLKESDIGSGFGLFFVDAMMERYGGDVRIEDNEPRGAVFVLELRAA